MKDLVYFIRATTRPFLTAWFAISWTVFVFYTYSNGGTIDDVPLQYTGIVVGIVGWWFYSRDKAKKQPDNEKGQGDVK